MRHLNLSSVCSRRRIDNFLWVEVFALASVLLASLMASAQDTAPPPPPDAQQQVAPDTNNVRAVRLSDVEGKVQVFNGSAQAFDQAQPNMPVMEGMRLVAAGDGRVEVQFEDGSVARVTPNSSITLSQLHRNADGSTVTAIDANSGLTYYELNGRAGQYSVRFGPNTVTPTDSSIFRVSLDQNPELAVTHGTVHLSDGQNLAVDVHTNQSVQFDAQTPGQYAVVQSVTADSWDQWNSDRDQALATLEEGATTARASSGNPDDPAWNDLDYYGDWYDVPGYGQAWAPSGVGAGFDPFGVGAWGYYSGVGYTWISGYPWGWWPYHCGAWDYFGSYGWLWFPGNCGWGSFGAGWYPYATVWRNPPGYKLPFRPTSPGHGLPPHGPIPHPQPLITVNRTPDALQQFRAVGQPRPVARDFAYDGQQIHPEQATIHFGHGGPLGEGFTASATRSNPELLRAPALNAGSNFSFGDGGRGAYPGSRISNPPAYNPGNRAGWSGGSARPSESPHYSAPAPSFHAAPAPSGGAAHPR
jgi:FecR protein